MALLVLLVVALVALAVSVPRLRASGSGRTPPSARQWLPEGQYLRRLTVGGLQRHYLLRVPPGLDQSRPVPAVLGFHGGGATPYGFAETTALSGQAAGRHFVTAYPAGYLGSWNAGDCCGEAQRRNVDDVAFVMALLDDLGRVVNLDRRSVFATGWSNGGKFALRLVCERSESIAAVAIVDSGLGTGDCRPARPVPLLMFHGTADTFHPYAGGLPGEPTAPRVPQVGATETARRWARLNGCSGEPRISSQRGAATAVTYGNCREGATVTLWTIHGMGHQWPGHTIRVSAGEAHQRGLGAWVARLGPGTEDIDATELILAFFDARRRVP